MKLLDLFNPFGKQIPKKAFFNHRGFNEALKRLQYSLELDGISLLLAEHGYGKSFLMKILASQLKNEGWVIHYFTHSTTSPSGFLNVVARNFGSPIKRSSAETADCLKKMIVSDKKQHLICVDESQELPDKTLLDIRLLTIDDFDQNRPFFLLLAGQPSLDERLTEPKHRALDQRITTVAHLEPLSFEEVGQYITIRITAAGAKNLPLFDDDAIQVIFESTSGVPRRINTLSTSALIVCASRNRRIVSAQDVQDALVDRRRV